MSNHIISHHTTSRHILSHHAQFISKQLSNAFSQIIFFPKYHFFPGFIASEDFSLSLELLNSPVSVDILRNIPTVPDGPG